MNIHEYQAKEILSKYGVSTPRGGIAYSPENAKDRATELGGDMWVVKAQIHSGARGKAGGIIICKTLQEVSDAANKLLGKTLVTNQTGPEGLTVQRVYIEEATDIKKEYYLGLVFDRSTESITVVASSEGGMSIEEIAKEKPETLIHSKVEAAVGMQSFQAREIAFGLGLEAKAISRCAEAILGCYKAFSNSDATMVEINPLVLTSDDHILALDCKMSFDDNALYRIPHIAELRDKTQEDPKETYAADRGLNYIALDGDIGNIINGAGLAMASMDMIQLAGGQPANFLDVGGAANVKTVKNGFKIILKDENVKAILINIFGGIVRCDRVANGVIQAVKELNLDVPVIVRLEGTNAIEAKQILADSGVAIIPAESIQDAATKAVNAALAI